MNDHPHRSSPYHDHNSHRPPSVTVEQITVVRFLRGIGCCEQSPVREVTAYYAADGSLLFESDPMPGGEA